MSRPWHVAGAAVLATAVCAAPAVAHAPREGPRLSRIGPAPDFRLTTQDGARLSLRDLRGKVVAVTFIYTSCADTCPLLTAKLVELQRDLGLEFGRRVFFVAITVDPERDTPAVLKHYSKTHGANLRGWAFLTGQPADIRKVATRYGVYAKKQDRGDVDHTFLTSIVDARGILRVQYVGVSFDSDEFLGDIEALLAEEGMR